MITVDDLIEKLKTYPREASVRIAAEQHCVYDIERIEEILSQSTPAIILRAE